MSKSRYPRCEELGVTVVPMRSWGGPAPEVHCVCASDLERVLESAPVVYGTQDIYGSNFWSADKSGPDTHTARLLCVKPIVKDTAEILLEEIVKADVGTQMGWNRRQNAIQRARRLLESK